MVDAFLERHGHRVERAQAFERWTIARQNVVLNQTICLHDDLPEPAAVDLTQYLPFLRIQ